jgi:dTDP-4-dehydrorhamnose reductase
MRKLVLVLGAGGQLGEAIAEALPAHHEVVARAHADLDVADPRALRDAVAAICPDIVINCAAYTDVDGAERHTVQALAVNAWPARTLARVCTEIDATLVHFSTDFVFDGETAEPYAEEAAVNPRGAYAASKVLGEWLAVEAPRHYVLRVESLFGGPRAKSSVDRMLSAIRAGTEVRAFVDRVVSPSFVPDVVAATAALLSDGAPYGLYHCVNSGRATWADLARELARLAGRPEAHIIEVGLADASLIAPRPRFSALSNAKLAAAGITMPPWQDALARYVRALDDTAEST